MKYYANEHSQSVHHNIRKDVAILLELFCNLWYLHTGTRIHNAISSLFSFPDDDDSLDISTEVIGNQRVLLSQKLSADDLMDYLIAERLVDSNVGEKLGMMSFTPMEKNRMIINCLAKGGPGTLKKFCAILRKVKKYSYIADELERGMKCLSCVD